MSLYNDASLAMIPSAVKDGKLYSIRPTDGSGDFTFSRGSNLAATRVDVNGLIEKGRENLLLQSNQFDTTWSLTTSISVTASQPDKDGGTNAWLLKRADGSSRHIKQTISQSGVQSFSVYLKAETTEWVYLFLGGTTSWAYFDLGSGSVGLTNSLIDSSIEAAGNGFYRCTITASASTSEVRIYPAQGNGTVSGDSDNGVYIQDAQLEVGLVATDYIETTTTTAVSGITEDLPRLDYSGGASCPSLLLEPTRTNVIAQSEFFGAWDNDTNTSLTANAIESPSGFVDAYKLIAGTSVARQAIKFSVTPSGDVVQSIYAKKGEYSVVQITNGRSPSLYANFDLENGIIGNYQDCTASIEVFNDGWYRCVIVYNSTLDIVNSRISIAESPTQARLVDFASNGSDGIYIWGAQVESNASYVSSYIPTYGSAVTRVQDTYQKSGFGNISTAGTLFYEFSNYQSPLSANGQYMVALFVGSSIGDAFFSQPNSISIINNGLLVEGRNNGYATTLFSFEPTAESVKVALRYDGTNVVAFVNGVKQTEFADTAVGVKNAIRVNNGENSSHATKQLLFFPTALTDSECIALTTL